jgi:hypothetical protein
MADGEETMKFRLVGWVLGAALALLVARQAAAVWTLTRLTPAGMKDGDRTFSIRAEPREGYTQFSVTVTPKTKPLSPFADGELQVIQNEKSTALVPIATHWKKGTVSFWFRLSREAVAGSRFEFREQVYVRSKDGEPSPDPEPGVLLLYAGLRRGGCGAEKLTVFWDTSSRLPSTTLREKTDGFPRRISVLPGVPVKPGWHLRDRHRSPPIFASTRLQRKPGQAHQP